MINDAFQDSSPFAGWVEFEDEHCNAYRAERLGPIMQPGGMHRWAFYCKFRGAGFVRMATVLAPAEPDLRAMLENANEAAEAFGEGKSA